LSVAFVSAKVGRELKEIGLTEYECMAYLALVKYGELTAGQVSENTSIPYSKVYTVLDSLEKKGWIEIRSHARGNSIIRCCWLDVVLLYKQISHLTVRFNQRIPQ
jgi:DNA-binding MarR family transcriptional regulator